MTVPRSPSPSSSPTTSDATIPPHTADHATPPPPNHVIPTLPPTPTLMEQFFPTTTPDSDSTASSTPPAPQGGGRFRNLVWSLDRLLAQTVAPLTVDNLRTELSDLLRDEPQAAQDYVDAIKHYVLERSKRHLIYLIHTDKTREKLNQLDEDIKEARALVHNREQQAQAEGRLPDPLTAEELRALMPDPTKTVLAIRKQVLDSSLADLQRERDRLEDEVAQDLARLRALRTKYLQMVEQRNAMEQQFQQALRPLVEVDLKAVDEALAHGEEMSIVFDVEDDLPTML